MGKECVFVSVCVCVCERARDMRDERDLLAISHLLSAATDVSMVINPQESARDGELFEQRNVSAENAF